MLIAVGVAVFVGLGFVAPLEVACDRDSIFTTGCASVSGTLGPDSAILDASVNGGGSGADSGGSGDPAASAPPDKCLGRVIVKEGECAPTIPGTLALSDIAAFRPDVGTNAMQPNGWAIVGLDTNFFSRGGEETVDGTLLGGPAQVRFTPVAWTWSYGDGATKRTGTAGGTWAELGIPEFDATPTSHVYAAKGTYTITLTIDYVAEYRLGSGAWVPIAGVLSLPSNPLLITVGSAKTVLVEEDCRENPDGPGC
ncbi:MAG: PKD domain-containing protein [Rhodoglobus sp.]